jgi:hypothetical protein
MGGGGMKREDQLTEAFGLLNWCFTINTAMVITPASLTHPPEYFEYETTPELTAEALLWAYKDTDKGLSGYIDDVLAPHWGDTGAMSEALIDNLKFFNEAEEICQEYHDLGYFDYIFDQH